MCTFSYKIKLIFNPQHPKCSRFHGLHCNLILEFSCHPRHTPRVSSDNLIFFLLSNFGGSFASWKNTSTALFVSSGFMALPDDVRHSLVHTQGFTMTCSFYNSLDTRLVGFAGSHLTRHIKVQHTYQEMHPGVQISEVFFDYLITFLTNIQMKSTAPLPSSLFPPFLILNVWRTSILLFTCYSSFITLYQTTWHPHNSCPLFIY